jgi:hypothetical protein
LESTSGALADHAAAIKRDPSYANTVRMRDEGGRMNSQFRLHPSSFALDHRLEHIADDGVGALLPASQAIGSIGDHDHHLQRVDHHNLSLQSFARHFPT